MAPEILWNYTYTKAVDVWSCAIIMYMLKKKSHPFYEAGMSNEDFKEKIKNIVFPPLEDVNP
jgi:serine/threonine protein kinase